MMSATATTPHHHRLPLATALAIAGAITAAVALGFAWDQSHNSSKPAETPAVSTHNIPYHTGNATSEDRPSSGDQTQAFPSPPGGKVQIGE
jgi:hypothetical protein